MQAREGRQAVRTDSGVLPAPQCAHRASQAAQGRAAATPAGQESNPLSPSVLTSSTTALGLS